MSAIDPKFLLATYPSRQWSLPAGGALSDISWLDGKEAPSTLAADYEKWGASQQWGAYQQQAKSALDVSDVTVLRCLEHGVAVPSEWTSYRSALRAIVSALTGDASQPLPIRPAYPAGT